MAIHLDQEEFRLYGTCDKCGSPLYCIQVETGTAACSSDKCEDERFDPAQFVDAEPSNEMSFTTATGE